MSGFEVARRLRAAEGGAALTMVAVTGYGQDEDRRQAREAGFDHYLTKPVRLEELQRVLASTTERRHCHPTVIGAWRSRARQRPRDRL